MVSDGNIRVCVERLCQRVFSQEEEDVDGGALGGWREGEGEAKVGGSRTPRLANMQRRHQGHTHKHAHTRIQRESAEGSNEMKPDIARRRRRRRGSSCAPHRHRHCPPPSKKHGRACLSAKCIPKG